MRKILVVEDNHEYKEFLSSEFSQAGYNVDDVDNPIKGLEKLAINKYDAVISDLNLPIMSGIQFTDSVKNISPKTVCIILTGNPDETDEIASINNNIDLFIEKRKSIDVIIAYINRLVSRGELRAKKDTVLTSKDMDLKLIVGNHTVTKSGVEIELTPIEYEMLRLLLANKNRVVTREEFIQRIWQDNHKEADNRLVDNHIKNLRDKLKSISIMTVRGLGYRWNEVEKH